MKSILGYLFLIAVLFACKSKKEVPFGMYSIYKLDPGEENFYPVPKEKVEEYKECCKLDADIYLNRTIANKSKNYRVFIGASSEIHSSEFNAYQINDSSFVWLADKTFTAKTKCQAFFLKKNNFYLSRVVFDEPKSGLILMYDYVSTDSTNTKAYYNNLESFFSKKVH
ncbi:MAG: hypothetical protein HUU48_01460 [Flavobacteriales bacterium]|nr:hypothetical protein [Flavobacteriales bacterium]